MFIINILYLAGILLFIAFIVAIGLLRGMFMRGRQWCSSLFRKKSTTTNTHTQRKKKVFADNEGEYVSYEEVDEKDK